MVSRASNCERRAFRGRRHDLVREPDAGDLHVRIDERRLETGLWRGVRHRHRRKPPATATPYRLPLPRQLPTLPFSATDPSWETKVTRLKEGPELMVEFCDDKVRVGPGSSRLSSTRSGNCPPNPTTFKDNVLTVNLNNSLLRVSYQKGMWIVDEVPSSPR